MAQLDKVYFMETNANNQEHKYNSLLLESNIMSCSFDQVTRHLMVSMRPSQKCAKVRHQVYEMVYTPSHAVAEVSAEQPAAQNYAINLVQTFLGSTEQKMLAKSKLFVMENNELYASVSDEHSRSLNLWSVNRNELSWKLSNSSEVLDSCSIRVDNGMSNVICSLTDKQLRIFRRN